MILVDTNVIIDIERGKLELKEIFLQYPEIPCCISEITLMELYAGLGYSKQKMGEEFYQKQKDRLKKILMDFELIPITGDILKKAGLKRGELLSQGTIIDNEDILIGITGELLRFPKLITRNPNHFKIFELNILSY